MFFREYKKVKNPRIYLVDITGIFLNEYETADTPWRDTFTNIFQSEFCFDFQFLLKQ